MDNFNNQYLNADFFNNTNTDYNEPIYFSRTDFISRVVQDLDKFAICPILWTLDTNSIPSYIPSLRYDNNDAVIGINNSETNLNYNSTNLYFVVSNNGFASPYGSFVSWSSVDKSLPIPNNFSTRKEVINNKYYYSYNGIYIFKLLENQINIMLANLNLGYYCRIIKTSSNTESEYSLCFSKNCVDSGCELYFNDELLKIFPLNTEPVYFSGTKLNKVIFSKTNTLMIENIDFYVQHTKNNSSYIFPFVKILFKTNIPLVYEQLEGNLISNNSSDNILTDYTIISEDPDKIHDYIIYEPDSYERWINCSKASSNNANFYIHLFLRTREGFEVALPLCKGGLFSIKLMIKQIY